MPWQGSAAYSESIGRSLFGEIEKMKQPRCEFCKYFRGYNGLRMECEAFPDGIPDDKNIYDYGDNSECSNGIKFEDKDGDFKEFSAESGSLLERMHRI